MELAFASLHQLCAPLLVGLDRLPAPQREALRIVFGLAAGPPPDRFLIGLAVLSLLSDAAEERPLLCAVDDSHWLDQASARTLGFVARRLRAEPIGLLFAAREPGPELADLPELEVRGLRQADARALLGSVVRFVLDERVGDRIVAETRGNPLALLELPRGLTATQLAGGLGLVGGHGIPGGIEERYRARLAELPPDAVRLLTVAAAEPVGDPLVVWRAAERLGVVATVVAGAATDDLLTITERVTFRHPLVRSAVYRYAPADERRAAHLALAEVTDPDVDPDRRAWHLAAAAAGPDEEVAARARALRRPGPGARRGQRRGRVPSAVGRADGRPRPARRPCARRGRGEPAGRGVRTGTRAPVHRGGRSAGRRPAGARRPAARRGRLRPAPQQRRRAPAAAGRADAGAARPGARARDLPRRLERRAVRRLPGRGGREPAGRLARGAHRAAARRPRGRVRPPARRPRGAVHRRARRRHRRAGARGDRLHDRRGHGRRGPALGLAGHGRGGRVLGLRDVPGGGDARRRAGPRVRRAVGARGLGQRPGPGRRAQRRPQHDRAAGRRGRRGHRGDRGARRALRRARARRPPRARARGHHLDRRDDRRGDGRRPGHRGPVRAVVARDPPQRARSL